MITTNIKKWAKIILPSGTIVRAKLALGGWWYYDRKKREYEMVPLDASFAT